MIADTIFNEWECRRCGHKAKLNAFALQAFCPQSHKMIKVKDSPKKVSKTVRRTDESEVR